MLVYILFNREQAFCVLDGLPVPNPLTRAPEHAPAQHDGFGIFLCILVESSRAYVAAPGINTALDLDRDHLIGPGKVETPAPLTELIFPLPGREFVGQQLNPELGL